MLIDWFLYEAWWLRLNCLGHTKLDDYEKTHE